jgi:hypothetical protein
MKITYKVIQDEQKEDKKKSYSICEGFYKGDKFCEFVLYTNRISQYRFFYNEKNTDALFGSLNSIIRKL